MPTTTNYGWTTPADTDLVKDGAAAIRTLGSSIDSTLKTQIDAQIPDSLLTTKGDIIAATGASTPARLGVGTNDQVLIADSTTATGLKWGSVAGGAYTTIASGNLSGSSTVTISSIPATYRNLVFVIQQPTTAGASQYMCARINGISTASYQLTMMKAASTSLTQSSTPTFWYLDNQDQTIPSAANATFYVLTFNEYANSVAYKNYIGNSTINNGVANIQIGTMLANTNAITSVSALTSGGSNFTGGSYVLYGVK